MGKRASLDNLYDKDLLVCLFSFVFVSPEESWASGENSFLQEWQDN